MMAGRTFGTKLAGGFALTVALTLLMGGASVAALTVVAASKDDVIAAGGDLVATERLNTAMETRISNYRGYLFTGERTYLDLTVAGRADFLGQVGRLRDALSDPEALRLLAAVTVAEAEHAKALDPVIARRATVRNLADAGQLDAGDIAPVRVKLQAAVIALQDRVNTEAVAAQRRSAGVAMAAVVLVIVLSVLTIVTAAVIAYRLSRGLRREVGAAVAHIQSSSAQLEAAAAQQAAGGRDQATAMTEITATISELLITSRQIADSAQRVSQIAEDTAAAAETGDVTIDQTRRSIAAIRAQVDQIVSHMLALGEKSQQIGGVVDLVSELAEQTNILAINATIEASGAGEWGRRFAVVAEEIRKLADRTAGSAKEIRALIEDVRGAVNTTVMATEIGAKSVDAGARQFDDATREIELTTKQQTTAVEQVNVAASDTARVTRETEASAVQTKQTASHLSTLSGDLLDLVGSGRR